MHRGLIHQKFRGVLSELRFTPETHCQKLCGGPSFEIDNDKSQNCRHDLYSEKDSGRFIVHKFDGVVALSDSWVITQRAYERGGSYMSQLNMTATFDNEMCSTGEKLNTGALRGKWKGDFARDGWGRARHGPGLGPEHQDLNLLYEFSGGIVVNGVIMRYFDEPPCGLKPTHICFAYAVRLKLLSTCRL